MNSRGQASLEYLMTYGWALIMIATVIAVLIFLTQAPTQEVKFVSSQPTKLLLKSSSIDNTTNIAKVVLQNITGGQIEITTIEESRNWHSKQRRRMRTRSTKLLRQWYC